MSTAPLPMPTKTMAFPARIFVIIIVYGFSLHGYAQSNLTLMELNAENFFDTIDNPLTNDDSFLPSSIRKWNTGKFYRKCRNLGKTIAAVGGKERLPDLVALCEVESDSALNSFVHTGILRNAGYDYFMTHSLDLRGLNVALLYRRVSFVPIGSETIRPDFSGLPPKRTRDVLHVSGKIATGDTLDVFVCHMPSRLDRHRRGLRYRCRVASQIKDKVDSLMSARKDAYIVITGDFNASPGSRSLSEALGASPAIDSVGNDEESLFCMIDGHSGVGDVRGTYCYKDKWEVIDNIIVNGKLLNESSRIYTKKEYCSIFSSPFLLCEGAVSKIPYRTYSGMRWLGGFSDHLPVVARFVLAFKNR